MKKSVCVLVLCMFILGLNGPRIVLADNVQLPKSDADRQTPLNTLTDFFATAGKSPTEKKKIVRQRKAIRREDRLRQERRQQSQRSQKQIQRQQKVILDKVNAVNQARYNKQKK